MFYLLEHSLIANEKQEVGVNRKVKAYLFKGGSVVQKERNACASSSDAFAKIGQAICAILT